MKSIFLINDLLSWPNGTLLIIDSRVISLHKVMNFRGRFAYLDRLTIFYRNKIIRFEIYRLYVGPLCSSTIVISNDVDNLRFLSLQAWAEIFFPGFESLSTRSAQLDGSFTKHARKETLENLECPLQFPNPASLTKSVQEQVGMVNWDALAALNIAHPSTKTTPNIIMIVSRSVLKWNYSG